MCKCIQTNVERIREFQFIVRHHVFSWR